jgi:hypothetical protein
MSGLSKMTVLKNSCQFGNPVLLGKGIEKFGPSIVELAHDRSWFPCCHFDFIV